MVVPVRNLARLPDRVPFDQGAVLTDAVATPYHALTRRGRLSPGESVAVLGCGGLGLHAVQLAKLLGAGRVIALDVSEVALERARERGADVVCRPDREDFLEVIKQATGGRGVDLSLECIGLQNTIASAVQVLRTGGRAVIVGLGSENIVTLPPTEFVRRELFPAGLLRLHHQGNRRTDRLGGGRKAGPLRLDLPTDSTGSRQSGVRGPASKDR